MDTKQIETLLRELSPAEDTTPPASFQHRVWAEIRHREAVGLAHLRDYATANHPPGLVTGWLLGAVAGFALWAIFWAGFMVLPEQRPSFSSPTQMHDLLVFHPEAHEMPLLSLSAGSK